MNEVSIKNAYSALHSNGAIQGTIGIVIIIALIIMIFQALKAYDVSKLDNAKGNIKVMFDLLILYGKQAFFIMIFPFLLGAIENVLGSVQDSVSSKFNASVTISGTNYAQQMIDNYINEKVAEKNEAYENAGLIDKAKMNISDSLDIWQEIEKEVAGLISLICIYLLKYLYFFFCSGRYLWLLMLEIVAPIAIICAMSDKTVDIFKSWAKNMILCYLLVPFFLMADVFGETIIEMMFKDSDFSAYGIFGAIGMVVLKIFLFGVVAKRTLNLI